MCLFLLDEGCRLRSHYENVTKAVEMSNYGLIQLEPGQQSPIENVMTTNQMY